MMIKYNDDYWMQQALELALQASANNEVPIGAIVVLDNKIIGTGYNQPISTKDPSAHAEIVALRNAAKTINNYRLINANLYVTLEPCPMCAGALLYSRIKKVIFGAMDSKAGVFGSKLNLVQDYKWNHKLEFVGGILATECGDLLTKFFAKKRKQE